MCGNYTTSSSSQNHCHKAEWIHAFMWFTPQSDHLHSAVEIKTGQTRKRFSIFDCPVVVSQRVL